MTRMRFAEVFHDSGGSFHRTPTTKMGDSPLIHTARHVGYTILRIKRPFRRAAKVTMALPFI